MALNSDCRVIISDDKMTAKLYLTPPAGGEMYSVEEVSDFLRKNGVNSGIQFTAIEEITKERLYYNELPVAEGKAPVHGINGYYEFFFDQEKKAKKPLIRSDGSVDYQSMSVIHNVRKGDKLATYHPAVQGTHGMDVTGREFRAHVAKELPQIHGTGFELSYDNLTYIATIDGKVEYDNYKLFVKDVYEFKGDLDLIVGKIDFRGDVIVHGNVCSGTTIRASKSITVEGSVEAATLIAEGDVILKKGMQGGKRAKVISGGSVYANFLEFTEVEAKENVEANIIMNCVIKAGQNIIVSGKRGAVVGGNVYCVGALTTTFMGNGVGIKTTASVGVTEDVEKRNHLLRVKAETTKASLAKTLMEIQNVKTSLLVSESKEVRDAKIKQLERRKERDERLLEHVGKELKKIEETMTTARDAKILVNNMVYSDTRVRIDDQELLIMDNEKKVEFYRDDKTEGIKKRSVV